MELILTCVLSLLAGCGVFMAGMSFMGEGLEKSAGSGMKKLFRKVGDNPFVNVGIGTVFTGIIQSSAATTVMAIGFVNAGAMTLLQATYIVMGANIGTTVTGIIVSLSALNIDMYMALFAFIGIMMMFFKNEKLKRIGQVLCGLGMVFVGLSLMSDSFKEQEVKDAFASVFTAVDFPLLLMLIGLVFTALIQSSSTTTGLLVILVGSGAMDLSAALFIVLGANIGTCVTAFLASTGTNANAKRTAVIHLTFNVIGNVIFFVVLSFLSEQVCFLLQSVIAQPGIQLAWFHVIFNVTTTIVLLPFAKLLTKLATKIVPDKKQKHEAEITPRFIDDRLLQTPPIAIMQVKKEVAYMGELAQANLKTAFAGLVRQDLSAKEEIVRNEAVIDFTNNAVTRYLIKLGPLVTNKDEKALGSYFHVVNDVERIGDHAENLLDMTERMIDEDLQFSDEAIGELKEMYGKVEQMFALAEQIFDKPTPQGLEAITALENEVDGLKGKLSASHVARLSSGDCEVEKGAYFYSLISGLERVADHLVNVAYSTQNPTGSQSLARKEAAQK